MRYIFQVIKDEDWTRQGNRTDLLKKLSNPATAMKPSYSYESSDVTESFPPPTPTNNTF
jgi:hypothetical protein